MKSFEHDGDIDPRPHGNCYWLARGRIIAGEYPRTLNEADSRLKLGAILEANDEPGAHVRRTGRSARGKLPAPRCEAPSE